MLLNLFLLSIAALCAIPTTLRQFVPSLQRIDALIQIPRVPEPPAAVDRLASQSGGVALRVRGLKFAFSGNERTLFHNIDIDIPAGAVLGWVCPSGLRQTNLAKALVGGFGPTAGPRSISE